MVGFNSERLLTVSARVTTLTKLYKAKDDECAPCAKLSSYIKDTGIEVDTTVITFESLRRGDFPFKVVPSLVLEDGSVISGFPKIRLKLSQKEI